MENLTNSLLDFLKGIGSRLMDFDDPVMMALAGLAVVLVFLWLFWSVRQTSVARQRLHHLNKALSEDASYGLGSLITQLGEEHRGHSQSPANYASPTPNSPMNSNPPAEEQIGFSGFTEENITADEKTADKKVDSDFSVAPVNASPVIEEESTIEFYEELNPIEQPEATVVEQPIKQPAVSSNPKTEPSLEESLTLTELEPAPPAPQAEPTELPDALAEVEENIERDSWMVEMLPTDLLEGGANNPEPESEPAETREPLLLEPENTVENEPTVPDEKYAAPEPPKKAEPLGLSLDQLIEEPEVPIETSAEPEPVEPVAVAEESPPEPEPIEPVEIESPPALESEPPAIESTPIPEEELEDIEVAIDEEKPAPPVADEPSAIPDATVATETVIENKVVSEPATPPEPEAIKPVEVESPPTLKSEPPAIESTPIPEEELEDIESAIDEKKSDSDTTPVEKENAPDEGKEESELPAEAPALPEETAESPSPQKPDSGKAQRLISRLETFQQNAEKSFASQGISPAENKAAQSSPASITSENLSRNSSKTEDGISPTQSLEDLETFLFTAKHKN